jgi:hypothetical protein
MKNYDIIEMGANFIHGYSPEHKLYHYTTGFEPIFHCALAYEAIKSFMGIVN